VRGYPELGCAVDGPIVRTTSSFGKHCLGNSEPLVRVAAIVAFTQATGIGTLDD